MGSTAVDLLLALMNGEPVESIVKAPELIPGSLHCSPGPSAPSEPQPSPAISRQEASCRSAEQR
ncbi:hypothetical protein ACW0JT_19680 [Arthrobacter sp. SA17]